MRKLLLASAAVLGATGGAAFAQSPPNPMSGQYAAPLLGGPGAQNNLNTFGTAQPGSSLAPAPGTVVIRMNGKVYAGMDASWGTGLTTGVGTITNGANATAAGTAVPGGNTTAYKLNPVSAVSYFRLYPGIDGMAANGLRYGAGVEIRENFEGGNGFSVSSSSTFTGTSAAGAAPTGTVATVTTLPSGTATSGTAASASGVSSAQTLFVRRAFTYIGSDQMGILRFGQQDGLVGIYDATGIFTTGSWDGGIGNLNNAGVQAVTPNQYLLSWPFLSGNGTEYGNNKVVYLSPQFFGIDVGFEYAPNQGNSFASSATTSPYQVGPCNTASANCPNVVSGTDSSRWINRWGFGARFIESFGGATIQGMGEYIISGKAKNGAALPAGIGAGKGGAGAGAGAIKYDAENEFVGGLAATFMGVTINGDFAIGRANGSNAMVSTGGAQMRGELLGISYSAGPIAFGAVGAIINSQGAVNLTGVSQRHEMAVAVGGVYKVAPGINLCLEYQYEQKHQGGFNFNSGAAGSAAGNDIHVQGLTLATIVNW